MGDDVRDNETRYDNKAAKESGHGKKDPVVAGRLDALCRRFEIAVASFGRSCGALRANERSFQAWYASSVIQEFGLARVYRELHLGKDQLFRGHTPGAKDLDAGLDVGHELFPDLAVSREPAIDARHEEARCEEVKDAVSLLSRIAIVTELKVTGSTMKHTPPAGIRRDLAKLMVFHRAVLSLAPRRQVHGLRCYMVILDNAPGKGEEAFKHHYSVEYMQEILRDVGKRWPPAVPEPTTILIEPKDLGARTHVFRALHAEPEEL
jgi:hypothetical protein